MSDDERAAAITALRTVADALERDPERTATGTLTVTRWYPPTTDDIAAGRTDMLEQTTTLHLNL